MNRTAAVLTFASLFVVACGGSGSSKPDFAEPFDAAVSHADAAAPSGDDAGVVVECPSTQTMCDTVCATLDTDSQNCGTCGTVCGDGLACVAGTCTNECGAGATFCGIGDGGAPDGGAAYCAVLADDNANCGACNHACDSTNETCTAGSCAHVFGAPYGVTKTIVTWTVPATATYQITAVGAAGGFGDQGNPGEAGGLGAVVSARFALTAGSTLQLLVGAQGSNGYQYSGGGGGGGSYVVAGTVPLVVAGGGSGGELSATNASITNDTSAMGVGGAGEDSGGGGGYSTNGGICVKESSTGDGAGRAFVNGGAGESCAGEGPGGFGGGGGGYDYGGGGGGYTGGRGASVDNGFIPFGGSSHVDSSAIASSFVQATVHGSGSITITLVP